MGILLVACNRQRELHVTRLRNEADPRCHAEHPERDYSMIFEEEDMKKVINTWRADVVSYMNQETLAAHGAMRRPQLAHQLEKNTHNPHMFHLSGCTWLLRQFLRLPLTSTISAARPAWQELLNGFEEHKKSPEYLMAVANSQRQADDHVRLSNLLWYARQNWNQGKYISFKVRHGLVGFYSLSQREQELSEDFEVGRSSRILDDLMKQQEERGTTNFHLLRMNPPQ